MLRNIVSTMKASLVYKHIFLLFIMFNLVAAFQPSGNHILLSDSKTSFFYPKDLSLPSMDIPSVDLNSLKDFSLPSIDIPTVDLNTLKGLTVDVPKIDASSALKVDETILVPAVTLVGILFVFGALRGRSGDGTSGLVTLKRSKPKKISPLAIPYDAAARFAYEEWLAKHGEKFNAEGFQVFKQKYDSMAVAESTYKKLVRDLEAFENKAPPPMPPRRIVPKKTPPPKKPSPFFFADE